mgnify:CR=1 FL=1
MGAIDQQISSRSAGVPGLEPRITEPESVVLPITPYPNGFHLSRLAAEAAGSNLHAHPAPTKSSGGEDRHTLIRTSVSSAATSPKQAVEQIRAAHGARAGAAHNSPRQPHSQAHQRRYPLDCRSSYSPRYPLGDRMRTHPPRHNHAGRGTHRTRCLVLGLCLTAGLALSACGPAHKGQLTLTQIGRASCRERV